MKILHSADLHLSTDSPESLETLDTLLDTAHDEVVDLLTIGGDIFDSPEDASRLRTEVRDLCSGLPFDVLAIPGNHDADVFEQAFDLGTDLEVLREEPYDEVEFGDVTVIGVPFRRSMTSDLFSALQGAGAEAATRLLLLHCTIDLGFGHEAAGDENEARYFPVELETLGRLDYEFVLAGHIHARFETKDLANGGRFVYPGSPIAHSWAERGPRFAALVDTDTGGVEPIELDTPYRDRQEYTVTPANQATIPDEIAAWIAEQDLERSTLEVAVRGYVDADEQAYNDRLREAAAPAEMRTAVESAATVLDHELYQEALARIDDEVLEEYDRATADGIEQLLISELAPLMHAGEVR